MQSAQDEWLKQNLREPAEILLQDLPFLVQLRKLGEFFLRIRSEPNAGNPETLSARIVDTLAELKAPKLKSAHLALGRWLAVYTTSEEVQAMPSVTKSHSLLVATVPSNDQRRELLHRIQEERPSVRKLRRDIQLGRETVRGERAHSFQEIVQTLRGVQSQLSNTLARLDDRVVPITGSLRKLDEQQRTKISSHVTITKSLLEQLRDNASARVEALNHQPMPLQA